MNIDSSFKTIVISIFIGLALIGVGILAVQRSGPGDAGPTVSVWGPMEKSAFDKAVKGAGEGENPVNIQYSQLSGENFTDALVDKLATQRAPDIVVVAHDEMIRMRSLLHPIPYSFYSLDRFRNTFSEGAEVYLGNDGVWAVPFAVDPLVMYWNRRIYTNAGIAQPPKYWEELIPAAERITKQDDSSNIETSAVALGEYENIRNAKGIISTLLLQAQNPIVERQNGEFDVTLRTTRTTQSQNNNPNNTAHSAIRFYTEFSDPAKSVYSWNRSLPESRQMFLASDLGTYFGYASELRRIRDANPNLNFDIATIPQIKNGKRRATFGKVYGFGVLKRSRNKEVAFQALQKMTSAEFGPKIAEVLNAVSVRRDVLAGNPDQEYSKTLYNAALTALAWPDPNPEETDTIFRGLIREVTSGRYSITNAISRADEKLENLLEQ